MFRSPLDRKLNREIWYLLLVVSAFSSLISRDKKLPSNTKPFHERKMCSSDRYYLFNLILLLSPQ